MDATAVLHFLRQGNQLKRTARTGWVQRGVPQAENVAAHSYGVVLAAFTLAQLIGQPIDLARVLAMAALHDLPEALTTDIPTPAWRFLPPGIKTDVERHAMHEILHHVPFAPHLMALWEELHAGETAESRLVHDADKLDMYLQATIYQEQTSNQHLDEFWVKPAHFHFAAAQILYDTLRMTR